MKKIITLGILISLLFPLTPTFANYTLENCTKSFDVNDENLFDKDSDKYFTSYTINPSPHPEANKEWLEYYWSQNKEALSLVQEINKKNNFTQKLNFWEDQSIIISYNKNNYAFVTNENYEFQIIENWKIVKNISQKYDDNGVWNNYPELQYGPSKLFIIESISPSQAKTIIHIDKKSFEFEGNYYIDVIIDDESYILADPDRILPAKLVKNWKIVKEIPNYSKTIILNNSNDTKYVIQQTLFDGGRYGNIFNYITEYWTFGPFWNISTLEITVSSNNNDWYAVVWNVNQLDAFLKEAQGFKNQIEALGKDLYDSQDSTPEKKLRELFNKHVNTKSYILKNGEIISEFDNEIIPSLIVKHDGTFIRSRLKADWVKNLNFNNDNDIINLLNSSEIIIDNNVLNKGNIALKLTKDETKILLLSFDINNGEKSKLCDLKNWNIKWELKNDSPQATYKLSAEYIKSIKKLAKEINALWEPRKTKMKNKLITLREKYKQDSPQYAILVELIKLIK